ncbi:hypothetical protein [Tenacibaculum sp. C7A-26P2]|uniref:hypothetical protein n=1 Tax=Tenacibaculum sp. C7A-26P2 TaxID=3447504 RepID=UPI003F832F00
MKQLNFLILFFIVIYSSFSQESENSFDSLIYKASTRGSFLFLKVTTETALYKTNEKEKSFKVSTKDQKRLLDLLNEIEFAEIQKYKAPTDNHSTDRAKQAEFLLIKGGNKYKSSIFDDGNPPHELKKIINAMMSCVK